MKIINVCDIEIPVSDGNIGIAVSGGMDSALLLYILMSNLADNQLLRIYTVAKKQTFYSSAVYSSSVIDYCVNKTKFNNIEHITRYIPKQTHNILYQPLLNDFNNGVISKFYSGVTANPPKDIADSFCGESANLCHADRDPLVYRDIFRENHSITPFTNIDKKKIHMLYKELDILDLANRTRSCENEHKEFINKHCGECWWCKERIWGFGNL